MRAVLQLPKLAGRPSALLRAALCLSIVVPGLFTQLVQADPQCPPPYEWQRSFGGTNENQLRGMSPTTDGGVILAGLSETGAGGNKNCDGFGLSDGWLVRLNRDGTRRWETCLGGSGPDAIDSIEQTSDGGFIAAGASASPPSGNRTALLTHPGLADHWVVRLDALGNILWDRSLGPYASLGGARIHESSDGGFIFGASNELAPEGGFKTAPAFGGVDYWLVRLDSSGNRLWDVSFGGGLNDVLSDLRETEDCGFLLVGTSYSPAGGNKQSDLGAVTQGWVVRVDKNGKKLWERGFGNFDQAGLTCVASAADRGFYLGGNNYRDNSQDLLPDCWVVRIDKDGQKLWERFYGFAGGGARSLSVSIGGGFVLGASAHTSFSAFTQNGSGNRVSLPIGAGGGGFWVARMDGDGSKLWDVTYGDDDESGEFAAAILTTDGRVVFRGTSGSRFPMSARRGFTGNKTVPQRGTQDYWVVRLAPETTVDRIQVCASTVLPHSSVPGQSGFRFRVAGPTNLVYALESSSNLVHWTQFGTNMNGNQLREVLDPSITNSSHRFFRARAGSPP